MHKTANQPLLRRQEQDTPNLDYKVINVKTLQFNQVLTATCIEWHIENSKNDKKVILAIITSPKRQCDAE